MMNCPACGTETTSSDVFCGACGAKLEQKRASGPELIRPHYVPVAEVQTPRRTGPLLIGLALLAGLLAGGVVFWRMYSDRAGHRPTPAAEQAASPQPQAQTEPAPAETAATPETSEKPRLERQPVKTESRPKRTASAAHAKADSTMAELNQPAQASKPEVTQTPLTAGASPAPQSKRASRPAVQEGESEAAPMPTVLTPPASPPGANPPAAPTPAREPPASAPQTPSPAPVPPVPAKPAYSGPRSGVAFWSGRLEKGQTLTINGGNASMGVLSGAGLPGVPVRITVDQTNLGFGEMPNAANGFRTLVLKSHGKHDKVTIRWVAQ